MNAHFRTALKKIQEELENLIEEHQEWMDDHDDDWLDTDAGCTNQEQNDSMQYALDNINEVLDD